MKSTRIHNLSAFAARFGRNRLIFCVLALSYIGASYTMAVHMKNLPTALNFRAVGGHDSKSTNESTKASWIPKRHLPLTKEIVALFSSSSLGHCFSHRGPRSSDTVEDPLRNFGLTNAADRAPPVIA